MTTPTETTTPSFLPFEKIPRLNRQVIITEKIDGTNAIIHIAADMETVTAGSRNRWLTTTGKNDNFGFAAWVMDNKPELLKLGPGYHFGEWWGLGIQRGYGLKDRRFSLFNTHRWGDPKKRPACCGVVPIIDIPAEIETNISAASNHAFGVLRNEGSLAAPGFMKPEGHVIFHVASGHLYKVLLEGDELPKSKAAQ
jgi:hypothetical protein